MRQQLPKILVVSGVLMMVVGIVAIVTMLVVQNRCQHDQRGYPDDPAVIAACSSYQTGAEWGYVVIALGVATIVVGAISGTPLIQGRGDLR